MGRFKNNYINDILRLIDVREVIIMKKIKKTKKNKNHFILLATFILAITTICTCLFLFFITPKLEIEDRSLTFSYDEDVILPKYHAYYMNRDVSRKVKIKNEVKEHQVGNYFVTYQLNSTFVPVKKLVLIKIVDTKKPVITLKGKEEVFLCPGSTYQEEGFQAVDGYDGDISNKVISQDMGDKILYHVEDKSHNVADMERKITYQDKEAPVITLKGSSNVYLYLNSTYEDAGYTVKDNCDKDISVQVSGSVNTKKEGSYPITYMAIDSSHNKTTVVRNVEVISKSSGDKGVIYLTFDDGPSNSITPKILDILSAKKISATFFVIHHDRSLNYLIKREYQEGHTVALHSYTHTYSTVYQSVNNYFNDLNQIRDEVYQITGEYSNIIRFPGGSSNTVSKKFQVGIMSELTSKVKEKGFHYFDWNVDCGDGAGIRDANKIYNNVISGLSPNRENVILMHDFENNYGTLNALEKIIDYGFTHGYQFRKITMDTREVHHKPNN